MVTRAAELGMSHIAITDRDGVYGLVRGFVKARELGIHLPRRLHMRQVAGLVDHNDQAETEHHEGEIDEILGVFERLQTVDSGRLGPAHAALDGRHAFLVVRLDDVAAAAVIEDLIDDGDPQRHDNRDDRDEYGNDVFVHGCMPPGLLTFVCASRAKGCIGPACNLLPLRGI